MVIQCQIGVRQRLSFDALRRIDDEQGAFARRQTA
jgi:hypothetical protein